MTETKKCEHCSREININCKICPFCGGEVRDRLEQNLPPVCPRCGVSLEIHTKDEEEYNTVIESMSHYDIESLSNRADG